MKSWRVYGSPRLERYRAEDFSILIRARRTRQTGPHRKRAMLH